MIVTPKAIDYNTPREKEEFIKFIYNWMNLHVSDHNSFIMALNSLRQQLGKPLLKTHRLDLFFDPEKLGLVNNFLIFNSIEHKEIYRNINELGDLALPKFIVVPIYNMVKYFMNLDIKNYGEFLFHENRVHTITARAINLLYESF